jgi:hypothetical protein
LALAHSMPVIDFGGGVLSNQAVLCRDPQVIDAGCGDGGRGILSDAELEALAMDGDAIALHYLAHRRRTAPGEALMLLDSAVIRGHVSSLGLMSNLFTQVAERATGPTRAAFAEDAYAHVIAGMMFGFGHLRVDLMGTHFDHFPGVPVSARVCDAAARLVERVNSERAMLGLKALTVYQDRDAIRATLREENDFCH